MIGAVYGSTHSLTYTLGAIALGPVVAAGLILLMRDSADFVEPAEACARPL